MSQRPVIFLAFANDRKDYLYKLTEEQDAIRTALDKAEEQGLCEVHYETDTDLNKIWKVFDRYKDRISIFHYGGHAEDYTLLLKKASGERQIGHAEGLVSFLGQQKGLKLVFINGCCSKRQAEELRDRGVPAVIGTARPVDDTMATQLSGKLYESLAEGRSLEQAWQGARDFVKAQKGDTGYSTGGFSFIRGAEAEKEVAFPWDLYIRPGSEHVKSWNLAREAHNPLFNLPLPESYFLRLRNSPFVGLHFFQEEDSALFFGRGVQIRELYNHIKGIHPIILLYGKSGVGKSSMLDAGLLPRIKGEYQSVYARRIQEKGLLGTLELALSEILGDQDMDEETDPQQEDIKAQLLNLLGQIKDTGFRQQIEGYLQRLDSKDAQAGMQLTSILKQWQAVEAQTDKPLMIILDQVEEKFTRPMKGGQSGKDELTDFLTSIQALFLGGDTGISGKLILSYRKEYHPEIRASFQALSLPFAELFLERLDRDGIIEAIQGINQHQITKQKYQLQIEENLPEIIADDLMEDSESPIAPVLQIILEKLWNTSWQGEHQPVNFTVPAYQELRKQGTTMDEFFQQQMLKLLNSHPAEVQSGLALDILHSHTTNLGTAGSRRRREILDAYEVKQDRMIQLVQHLQDLSLLVRIDQRHAGETDQEENYTTILAHDTLAPIVIRAYNLSDAPGQRAARILNNKLADVGYSLSSRDVNQLLAVHALSHQPGQSEEALRAELEQEYIGPANFRAMLRPYLQDDVEGRIEQRMFKGASINLAAGKEESFLAEGDLRIVEEGTGQAGKQLPGMPKLSAAGQKLIDLSLEKRAARIAREQAIRRRQRAFTIAISIALLVATTLGIWAWRSKTQADQKTREAQSAALTVKARQVYEEDPTFAISLAMAAHTTFPSKETQSAIHDFSEPPLRAYYVESYTYGGAKILNAFSSDGQYVLTTQDSIVRLCNLQGKEVATFAGHTSNVMSAVFSFDGSRVLTGSKDKTARLWDLQGKTLQEFKGHTASVFSVAFSPDGQRVLTGSGDSTAILWDLQGKTLKEFKGHAKFVTSVAFSPDGQRVLTGSGDSTAILWDARPEVPKDQGNLLQEFKGHTGFVTSVAFSPDGQQVLTGSWDQTARLWDLQGNQMVTFEGHSVSVRSVAFSPDGSQVLTGSGDETAILWDLTGNEIQTFDGVYSFALSFSPDGSRVLTGYNPHGYFDSSRVYSEKYLARASASASASASAKLWTLQKKEIQSFGGDNGFVWSVAFSPDGSRILTGSEDGTAKLWDLYGNEIQSFKAHNGSILSVAFSPDGSHVLTGSRDKTAILWNLQGNQIHTFVGHENWVYSVAFSPNGSQVLTGSRDGTARLWDLTGNEIQTFDGHGDFVFSVAFSPDGSQVLTGSKDKTAILWNLQGNQTHTFVGHTNYVSCVAFSPNGNQVLTGSWDQTAKLWDVQKKSSKTLGSEIQTFFGIGSSVYSVAFSPDGTRILAGSWVGPVKLWDLQGNPIQTLSGHRGPVYSVTFSPDGQHILTGSRDKTAKLWQTIYQIWEEGKIYKLSEEERAKYGIDWAY